MFIMLMMIHHGEFCLLVFCSITNLDTLHAGRVLQEWAA
jgi:hypothetical protein